MITYSDGTRSITLPTSAERAAMITHVGGRLDLRGYDHPLPPSLASVGGGLFLRGYEHPLPPSFTHVGGGLYLGGYRHPLPPSLTHVGGDLVLRGYRYPLPPSLASVGGWLNLRGYDHPLPPSLASGLPIPVIPHIDARIRDAIESGGELKMNNWHTCETTHCRAGWAVHLAGEEGRVLEKHLGTAGAGALIYQASRPGMMFPDFYASNDEAMADIIACAAMQEMAQ